jgi:hypothetical protein
MTALLGTRMSNTDLPVDPALPMKEVRRLIGRGTTSIYADIAAGKLRTFRNGARRFARASEINRYLEEREKESARG